MKSFYLIVAITREGCIGVNGELPWSKQEKKGDLERFSFITQFLNRNNKDKPNTVIMGRKTYESICQPLPNRTNIVLSSKENAEKCVYIKKTLKDALEFAEEMESPSVFVIGGSAVYEEAIKHNQCVGIFMTRVEHSVEKCDTYFPQKELVNFEKTTTPELSFVSKKNNTIPCCYVFYEKLEKRANKEQKFISI